MSLNLQPKNNDKFQLVFELDLLKEKYANGDYICLFFYQKMKVPKWTKTINPMFVKDHSYKLIHIKHKDILDAYLAYNSVEIQERSGSNWNTLTDWFTYYTESRDYRLKPQTQYPIFKRNENGEVVCCFGHNDVKLQLGKVTQDIGSLVIVKYGWYTASVWNTIPYDAERGLYHLQPVWFTSKHGYRTIGFYNMSNKNVFNSDGIPWAENNFYCENIEPITLDQLKTMPFIWDMYQYVLKVQQ